MKRLRDTKSQCCGQKAKVSSVIFSQSLRKNKTKSQELSIDDKFYRTLKSEPKKHIPKLLLCRFLKNYGRRIDRGGKDKLVLIIFLCNVK